MNRVWRVSLLVLALLFAQQGALLHSFKHLDDRGAGGKGSLPGQHLGAKCLAFHAVDSVLPCSKLALDPPRIEPLPPVLTALPLSRAPRIEFDSRAPPVLS
jgi:hypothetical protein